MGSIQDADAPAGLSGTEGWDFHARKLVTRASWDAASDPICYRGWDELVRTKFVYLNLTLQKRVSCRSKAEEVRVPGFQSRRQTSIFAALERHRSVTYGSAEM